MRYLRLKKNYSNRSTGQDCVVGETSLDSSSSLSSDKTGNTANPAVTSQNEGGEQMSQQEQGGAASGTPLLELKEPPPKPEEVAPPSRKHCTRSSEKNKTKDVGVEERKHPQEDHNRNVKPKSEEDILAVEKAGPFVSSAIDGLAGVDVGETAAMETTAATTAPTTESRG